LRDVLHYRLEKGQAWLYRSRSNGHPGIVGATLLYRRDAWAERPFPTVNVGEDTALIASLPPERVEALADDSLYVALLHGGNAGAKNLDLPCWERRPLDEVHGLLSLDREFYVGLRSNGHTPERGRSRRVQTSVTLATHFMVYDGYGSIAEYVALGMERAGATVHVVPFHVEPAGLTDELRALLERSRPDPAAPVLYYNPPGGQLDRFRRVDDVFVNTMWEASRLPRDWVPYLQRARAVIVPTRWMARVCRDSGVDVPVEVVPEGIDPDVYGYRERPERDAITTLIVGTYVERKHVREGIEGWKLAFDGDPNARLLIKARFNYRNFEPDDPRIEFIDTNETTRGIPHWYAEADVLLALGNEGFGLPLVEAMATGLPAIALDAEGQSDVCSDAAALVLPVAAASREAHYQEPFGRCGVHAVPAVDQIASQLRWVDEHRQEARELGRAASEWAIANRDVWAKGPAVLDVMERYVRPPRPLRRIRTLWVPSWGTTCGVAEYTAALLASVDGVRTTTVAPDFRATRVLHVQHESRLFEDKELTRCLQEAAFAGVPVVVTEHDVGWHMRAWEREAGVLVAHSEAARDLLRTRWPQKRIEHVPHGCPTWFPPRKRRRGRTIGAFGFLERHKGFLRVLDALTQLPETDLLLFAHARSADFAQEWRDATAGMPVRWVDDYLPVEEVAQRLAAEADVLVFPYDEVPHLSSSGAVRVGLATGVPVVTSGARWFDELGDAVHRSDVVVEGIGTVLEDAALRTRLTAAAREYCETNSWPRVSDRHVALWRELEAA
jgi:glycosyltransferase involved in cell wall biosynthesis